MNKSILWIEDEPAGCGTYSRKRMLEMKGYEVVLSTNVDEALDCIKAGNFDLILLDIMMLPGKAFINNADAKGGYETGVVFMKELKRQKKDIPVIVITAYPNTRVEHIFRDKYAVNYYFTKPINQIELEDAIEKELSNTPLVGV